jgi:hypothetical protein
MKEPSAAAHWSAEKVAPLVRQLPKTRQTVLNNATIQRRNSSVVVIIHQTGGNRWRTELCAEQPDMLRSESSCSATAYQSPAKIFIRE